MLHEYEAPDGQVLRRAWYVQEPATFITALLNTKAWHRHVGVIAGFLKNAGGFVRFEARHYALGGALASGPYALIDANDGGEPQPLIEG